MEPKTMTFNSVDMNDTLTNMNETLSKLITKVDRLHNKIDFVIGEVKSQAQHDTTRWYLYFKGSKFKKDAMKLLLWAVKEADLTSISSSTVRCQYVKILGSNK